MRVTEVRARVAASVAAIVIVACAAPAMAGIDAATTIKPLVVVLLDTSGSMEYEAGTALSKATEFTVPICEEAGAAGPVLMGAGSYPRSRLAIAKEVLTGSYDNYWCEYDRRDSDPGAIDYLYPVPHVRACGNVDGTGCKAPTQAFDGLMDVYRDSVKFSFMTFDSRDGSGISAAGMYSYGPDASLGINLGVKNNLWGDPNLANQWDQATQTWTYADPDRSTNNTGQLMAPATNDDFAPLRLANRMTQYEINSTIGYWGTPLAPMLQDTRWFLMNDPSVRPWDPGTETGDRYANCRDRIVILITDGRAEQGEGVGGYLTTAEAVVALKSTPPNNVKVYVVGYNLADDAATLLDELDGLAEDVFVADSAAGLTTALSEVMAEAQADIQSRTEVVYTNVTRSSLDLQYQFNAAFQADPLTPNIIGYLDQLIFRCSDDCAGITDGGYSCAMDYVPMHDKLNARSNLDRDMYAVLKGDRHDLEPALVDEAEDQAAMDDLFGVPQSGQLPSVMPSHFTGDIPVLSETPMGDATEMDVQIAYMRDVIRLVRADDASSRKGRKMGGITHATPVVQEAARFGRYPLRSWNEYVRTPIGSGDSAIEPRCRPTTLFTGTHDGQIHAFRVDRFAGGADCAALPTQGDSDVGEELWSIVPQTLLRNAHTLVGAHNFLMDGQLKLADVLLVREDPTNSDATLEASKWRSVLTAGFGLGGRGYIALDVSQVLDGPGVMWEISERGRCFEGTCHPSGALAADDYSKMGLTTPRPAYGTVFLEQREIAVAVLPAGDDPDDAGNPEAGRAVYIVRLDNGERIAEFSNTSNNVVDESAGATSLTHAFTGSPAIYADVPGVVSTRAFVGDAGGAMWRIDMRSDDPDEWKMQRFYDPYAAGAELEVSDPLERQPQVGAPALALDNSQGQLSVVFGAGSIDFVSDGAARTGVFSVSEIIEGASVSGELRWHRELDAGESLTGEPLIFGGVAYFTTYVPNNLDACDAGTGRLYGVDFNEGTEGAGTDTSLPALDEDGDPTTIDPVRYVSTGTAVPYGVQIIERPACVPGAGAVDGVGGTNLGGGVARGDLELVVNVAKGPGFDAKTVPPSIAAGTIATKNKVRKLATSAETFQSGTWGYVLY